MSEEKIIARRNKLIEWTKTQDIRCTPFCETINENINSINYLLHELQQKENIIKEVREYIYKHSTQRKAFISIADRQFNGKPKFYGDVCDLLEILDKGE